MLTILCRDVAADCDFVGRSKSEDELMMQMLGHIVKNHKSDLTQIMKSNIRKRIISNIRRST